MSNSGLRGPYPLTKTGVEDEVTKALPGAYVLGRSDTTAFRISYVGRADDDVRKRIRDHVPEPYPQFKYEYYPSPRAAFEKECNLYHDFTPPDNKAHPARPAGANWKCPVCSTFG